MKTRLFVLAVDLDDNGVYDLQVEVTPPGTFYWTVSYRYQDAALRLEFSALLERWRSRLALQMVEGFYSSEYFFHHGPEFVAADPVRRACP
ncbi:MAG: hypothetical protein QN157_13670 [Armatimonadota bacterium]|nr:hypothetical protein [Armatimonadota bacterium]